MQAKLISFPPQRPHAFCSPASAGLHAKYDDVNNSSYQRKTAEGKKIQRIALTLSDIQKLSIDDRQREIFVRPRVPSVKARHWQRSTHLSISPNVLPAGIGAVRINRESSTAA